MSQRWAIKSLRKFRDHELIISSYLVVGGLFSAAYALGAVLRTRLYQYVFSSQVLDNGHAIVHVSLEIIERSILRALLWFPQIIHGMWVEKQSLWDWITAANILKDLS